MSRAMPVGAILVVAPRPVEGRSQTVKLLGIALLALAAAFLFAPAPDLAANTTDYDADDDNLIEISNLAQLNAMRWDLNGEGTADYQPNDDDYAAAFPNAVPGMGCLSTCLGYELAANLDFDENGDGERNDNYNHRRRLVAHRQRRRPLHRRLRRRNLHHRQPLHKHQRHDRRQKAHRSVRQARRRR